MGISRAAIRVYSTSGFGVQHSGIRAQSLRLRVKANHLLKGLAVLGFSRRVVGFTK